MVNANDVTIFLYFFFRLSLDEQSLPVSINLPSGYLSCKPLGLGKGVSSLGIFFFNIPMIAFFFSLTAIGKINLIRKS